jgi:hypothetical protein
MGHYVILALAPSISEPDEFCEGLFIDVLCVSAAYHADAIPLMRYVCHED